MAKNDVNTNVEKLFSLTAKDILCNTSYPFVPSFFKNYKSTQDIMALENNISVYIHIPFCRKLCRFCEYTRFKSGNDAKERRYLANIKKQIIQYEKNHQIKLLYGLDIGGGTPTSLNHENFELLMEMASDINNKYPKVSDFESSIEFSSSTIDEDKIKMIKQAGFKRVSTGIQTYSKELLSENYRENVELNHLVKINGLLKKHGILKLNVDIMYGLPNQTLEMCNETMDMISRLNPEQVTLYETRYNMNGLDNQDITRKVLFEQYNVLFHRLVKMGYNARFGQNTFSKEKDGGVSSYLRYRMQDGIAYKGLGMSAQSMSKIGISYNSLKSSKELYLPDIDEIIEQDIYLLPPEEIAGKYVSIALYSARFSLEVLSNIIGESALSYYSDAFEFLSAGDYIRIVDNNCILTSKGFMYYGAVASMFWSRNHQLQYLLFMGKERC